MDWYDATVKYHERTFSQDCMLSSLPEDWQRQLAAIWRLEADINSGGYLQFLTNWGRESYEYGSEGLKRVGAATMARIIDTCQSLVDEHFDAQGKTHEDLRHLIPNEIIGVDGIVVKERGSVLPETVLERIMDLSYEFMDYPDDIATLGIDYFRHQLEIENVAEQSRKAETE